MTKQICPCGLDKPYASCCGFYIEDGVLPDTAERLMRSRYTAYVLAREDYLLHTWHPSTRPLNLALKEVAVKWLGLQVIRCEAGRAQDRTGMVEFLARYTFNGKAERLHEASDFVCENEQWFYVQGQIVLE